MGFLVDLFGKLFGVRAADGTLHGEREAWNLSTGRRFAVSIVGESHYQGELRRLQRTGENQFLAVLLPEPSNPHDQNAVQVRAHAGGCVGYLSREDALAYRDVLQFVTSQRRVGACRGKLTGGTGDKSFVGAVLDLKDPPTLEADLIETVAGNVTVMDAEFDAVTAAKHQTSSRLKSDSRFL